MTWHADTALLRQYARGESDDARAASLEAHLLACDRCQDALASLIPADPLERMWASVMDVVDAPKRRPVERLLTWIGVPDHVARLLAATPALRLSWLLAVAAALGFAVVASHAAGGTGTSADHRILPFLVVAPLIPLAGVATAYGPGVDPTYEIGLAAPMRSYRLLLIRALAVVATSSVLAGAASLTLPGLDWSAAAWLLPSLALSAAALVWSTYWPPQWAALTLAVGWVTLAISIELGSARDLAVFGAAGQLLFLLVLVGGAIVFLRRRQSVDFRRTT
jgi:hypothetical protein